MTPIGKTCRRQTRGALALAFGKDSGRPLVAELAPGDLLNLWPYRTRRVESVSLFDIYAWLIRARVNKKRAEEAEAKKANKKGKR